NRRLMIGSTSASPLDRLRTTDQKLPPPLAREIRALGPAAIPPLIALLEDGEASYDTAPGGGWPPIHAIDLLADLGALEAIPMMLRLLGDPGPLPLLHDRLLTRLHDLGPSVLEPALAAATETDDAEYRADIASIVAKLGVRDERIFTLLCDV